MTLQTLADRLGISRTTASNAFNRPDQLNPALREKVLALAAELGYAGPDPAGRALRSGRAGAIGVLLTERLSYAFGDPAAVATLRGLADRGRAVRHLALAPPRPAHRTASPTAAAVTPRARRRAASSTRCPPDHPSVDAALERRLPLVVADTPHMPGVPLVSIDDRGGARAAAQHLLDLGHRRLAVVSLRMRDDGRRGFVDEERRCDPVYRVTAERLDGLRGGVRRRRPRAGATSRSTRSTSTRARWPARRCPRCSRRRADRDPRHVRRARARRDRRRRAAGVELPRDLSVVGFDDAPPAAPRGLTTVRQPLVEKGRVAGRMLLEAIEGGDARRRRAPDRARRPRLDRKPQPSSGSTLVEG